MNRFTTLMMSKVRGIRVLDIAAAGWDTDLKASLLMLIVYAKAEA